jgi:hypothetical protein
MIKQSFVIVSLLCGACATHGDEVQLGETTQDMISLNGISLNGISLNGISLNGISLNGISLNGISVNGTSLTGVALTAAPASTTAAPLSGAGVVGSTWTAPVGNAASVKLRIDAAAQGGSPNADVWFYNVSYQTSTGWSPLCGLDAAGKPIQAVSVAGVWAATAADAASYGASTTQFTLACRGKTIAKCVELGYKTYKGYSTQLQSCVRMLRGDYCGTGVAYTVDGTELNLYDNVGVQADTQAWTVEAEWTPSGARCVNKDNAARYDLAVSRDPRCVKALKTATCGTTFANGAVLIDELSPVAVTQIQSETQFKTQSVK